LLYHPFSFLSGVLYLKPHWFLFNICKENIKQI